MKQIRLLLGIVAFCFVGANVMAQTATLDFTAGGTGSKFEGCEPYEVTFQATLANAGGKQIDKVEMTDGGAINVGTNDWDQINPSWSEFFSLDAGTYNPTFTITFTDGSSVDAVLSRPIEVFKNPTPRFVIERDSSQCLVGNQFCFINESKPGHPDNAIEKCLWNFGDGGSSQDCDPCYSYTVGGRKFDVTLQITDVKGCRADTTYSRFPEVYPEVGAKFRINELVKGCPEAEIRFINETKVNFNLVDKWVWDWGIGKKHIDTFSSDSANHVANRWTNFKRKFRKDGWISPKLVVFGKDGCKDSFILKNAFQVVNYKMEFVWSPDTACFAGNNVTFRMKPRPNAQAFLWTFGDPASMILNFNDDSWSPSHTFVGGPGWYNVTLSILELPCPVRDTTICFIKLKGPGAMITLPPPPAFPPHTCVEPREIPIEDFERLKYDACYRDSYDPMSTQYIGIMPESTLNPLNEIPIEQGFIRWVQVQENYTGLDSMFVYCNANRLQSVFGGDSLIIDTVRKPGLNNAVGNAIVAPRQTGEQAVGCNDYIMFADSMVFAEILDSGANYTPGRHLVVFQDTNVLTDDARGYIVVNSQGKVDSVVIKRGGDKYGLKDTTIMGFVDSTNIGGNGQLEIIGLADNDIYVYDTIFQLEAPNPGVNGEWRITSDQEWTQTFQPIWEYTDPIPVPRALKIKDFVTPVGGGASVEKEFTIFHPYLRVHTVEIDGVDYTYKPGKYHVDYIDQNGQPQTYRPPMYRGTSPLAPFPTDQCSDNFETMHDTDIYNCEGPNLVTFTNNSSKYRLFGRSGTELPPHPLYSPDNLSHAFLGQDNLIDSCAQNTNVPWGSDSLQYFWDFGDGDPCSLDIQNGKYVAINAGGTVDPNQDPMLCQYSLLAAPKHLYVDNDCYSARLTVYDPETDCQATASTTIYNTGPVSSPEEPAGPLTIYDVNSYNQGALLNDQNQRIRMGAQVGRTDAPCAANAFNRYFQNIDVGQTGCARQDYWMVFDAKNDCDVIDCITNSDGELFNTRIINEGETYNPGTYDVTFTSTTGNTTPGKGIAVINSLGYLERVAITDPGSGFTPQDTAVMDFDDKTNLGGNGKMKVIALSTKANYYRNGVIQEVVIKQRGAFYTPGIHDVEFPWPGVTDIAKGKATIDAAGFLSKVEMLTYGSGYPNILDSVFMEFVKPDEAKGNCKMVVAALPVKRNSFRSCPWIPRMVIEMILQNRWSYTSPGWKDIGIVTKNGDCFDTFFYENYKYIIDANADFQLNPSPLAFNQAGTQHIFESNRDFTQSLDNSICNGATGPTELPTKLPKDITLSIREFRRNDPNMLTNDSVKTLQYFITYEGDQCGSEPFDVVHTYSYTNFLDGQSYRNDTTFDTCAGDPMKGDPRLVNLHDTSTFTFKKPGKYRYSSNAESKYGASVCSGGASRQIWFGQFQCFTISDPVVCGSDTVEFRDSIYYWQDQLICDLAGDIFNYTCIDRTAFFYSPDSNAKRQFWYNNVVGYTGPRFKEAIAWDFDAPRFRKDNNGNEVRMEDWNRKMDSTLIEQWVNMDTIKTPTGRKRLFAQSGTAYDLALSGLDSLEALANTAKYVYGENGKGVGAYDVTLWARDSMGCWTPFTQKSGVRVVGVDADFSVGSGQDTFRYCVPANFTFRNKTLIREHDGNDTLKGEEDSVVFSQWHFGKEFGSFRDSSELTHPSHAYLLIDTYTVSLKVVTAQGCESFIEKKNYITLAGPRLRGFTIEEDTGCVTFRVKAKIDAPQGNDYNFSWNTYRDQLDNRTGEISNIDFDTVGRFPLFLRVQAELIDPVTKDTFFCTDEWPRIAPGIDADTVWITVLEKNPIKIADYDSVICPGHKVQFSMDKDNSFAGYDSLFWSSTNGQSDTVLAGEFTDLVFEKPGKYSVSLTGTGDWPICPTDDQVDVRVIDVLADIKKDITTPKDSSLAKWNFLNLSKPATKYEWNIYKLPEREVVYSLTKDANDTTPVRYDRFGEGLKDQKAEYEVQLVAHVGACTDTAHVNVGIDPTFKPFNVFSPNGDGVNDHFQFELQAAVEYKMTIYNRWGEVINRVDQDDNPKCEVPEGGGEDAKILCDFWDGTNFRTGAKAATGTYFYTFEYKYKGDEADAEMRTNHGTITLLR